jgi:hypothetical protein
MFDLHFIHAIKNGVRYFKADRFMFDPLFPNVSESMKARMFQWLQDNEIKFDSSYSGGAAEGLPLVAVELTEQYYDQQALANAAYSTVDEEGRVFHRYHLFTSQEVRANVYAKDMEQIRLIHRLIQATMLLFHKSFINAGYQNVIYTGTTPLVPDLGLEGEGLNVYGRQVRYAALNLLEIPGYIEDLNSIGIYDPLLDIQVHLEETTPEESGVSGGVKVSSNSNS